MLDVFVGIGFTSVMIMFILFRAVRMDRMQPWFTPFRPREKAANASQTPWKRKT
jgi:hypothetical protein